MTPWRVASATEPVQLAARSAAAPAGATPPGQVAWKPWVSEAKKPETRERRLAAALAKLRG